MVIYKRTKLQNSKTLTAAARRTVSGAVARCCGVLGETLGVHSSCVQSFDSLF
jgi:hypothetical protein